MLSITDLLALLDKWPSWKRITDAPARITALEQRVLMLEKQMRGGSGTDATCPKCGEPTFLLISSAPDDVFGQLGQSRRHYRCAECGFEESKLAG